MLLRFLLSVESFGSELFGDGFDLRAVFHFDNETEPPGVRPRDSGFEWFVGVFFSRGGQRRKELLLPWLLFSFSGSISGGWG